MIVAACTPRTHEPLFRDTLREAGINQYYYEMSNIREHCSWVHSKERKQPTEKAKDHESGCPLRGSATWNRCRNSICR